MTGGLPFEYAVLRVVPRVDRTALFPDLSMDAVLAALRGVCAVCDGDATAGQAGAQPLRSRFGWLTAPRSTVLQPGPVHSGLTSDPAAELDKLLDQLVRV